MLKSRETQKASSLIKIESSNDAKQYLISTYNWKVKQKTKTENKKILIMLSTRTKMDPLENARIPKIIPNKVASHLPW